MSRFGVALRLGRVSNLPTVWTNVLAGTALAGGDPWQAAMPVALLALSLFYCGGMYLNDAFDRGIDARERPGRPIPAGLATADAVFAAGFAMILGGLALLLLAAGIAQGSTPGAMAAGIALGGAILLYDMWHKGNPWGPALMGACRVLAYVSAGLALAGAAPVALLVACAVSLSYLIGLTYIAKQETLVRIGNLWPLAFLAAPIPYGLAILPQAGWQVGVLLAVIVAWIGGALALLRRRGPGDIPRAVVALIAGIALLDALFLLACGAPGAALLALGCFGATLALQRWVAGT